MMLVITRLNEAERGAEHFAETGRVVALHRKPAAFLRTFQ